MPLGLLNEAEQYVALPVGRGQARGERAFERGKRGDQVTSVVGRPCRRAQAVQSFGGFANAFAGRLYGLVVDNRQAAGDRALQEEARELDQAPTEEIVRRLSLAQIARERVGRDSSALSSMAGREPPPCPRRAPRPTPGLTDPAPAVVG